MGATLRQVNVLLGVAGAVALGWLALGTRSEPSKDAGVQQARVGDVNAGPELRGARATPRADGVEPPSRPAPATGATALDAAAGAFDVEGEVVDAEGRPVPNATVAFWTHASARLPDDVGMEDVPLERGRFHLRLDPPRRGHVAAFAPEHLPTYVEVVPPGPEGPLRLVLVPAPPLHVVVLDPDGARLANAVVNVRPARGRVPHAAPGPEGPHFIELTTNTDAQGEALLRVPDRGPVEVNAWSFALVTPPVALAQSMGHVELRLERPATIAVAAKTSVPVATDVVPWMQVDVQDDLHDGPTPGFAVRHRHGLLAEVQGLARGRWRLTISVDGYQPLTRTVAIDTPGATVPLDVVLDPDASRGCVEIAMSLRGDQHVCVLARRREDGDASWFPCDGAFHPATAGPGPPYASATGHWRSRALPLGSYDLLLVRSENRRVATVFPDPRTVCAWIPAVTIASLAATPVTPELGPGIYAPLGSIREARGPLLAIRVRGPGGLPLPLFAHEGRALDVTPDGRLPLPTCVLGPYPLASITLEIEPEQGVVRTVVLDRR